MEATKKQPCQVCFEEDETSFTKILYPLDLCEKSGHRPRNWARERIMNEARALTLVRELTNIPVPTLLAVGDRDDHGSFLKTARVPNAVPAMDIARECRHAAPRSPCRACPPVAEANAARFLEDVVLPQLRSMPRARETGLNGIVIPPAFVTEEDMRPFWPVKSAQEPIFHFIHGDLGPGNILVDKDTLEVVSVIDWENAGYFPEVCTRFCTGSKKEYYGFWVDQERREEYIRALLE